MFKPVSMRYVNIFVLEEDVERVTAALGSLGTLHLSQVGDDEAWTREQGGRRSEQRSGYESLERTLEELMDALQIPSVAPQSSYGAEPGRDLQQVREEIDTIGEGVDDWQERKSGAEEKMEQLQLLQEEVRALAPLDVSLERLRAFETLHLVVGSLPRENLERLQVALFRIPFVIIPVYEGDDCVLVYAACAAEDAAILRRALESAFFEPLELPEGLTGPPSEALQELEDQLDQVTETLRELEREREQMAQDHGDRLRVLRGVVRYNASLLETIDQFGQHDETYLISGWVPVGELEALVETVDETAEEKADVEVLEAGPKDQAPILLQNPGFLRPFETIVSVFGFPAYGEIDPTPIVALTFLLMFGMMFGDVGHGLLLTLFGLWLSRRDTESASLAPILIAAGISGMLFGALFGSLFGQEGILPHLWLSPLEDVMTLLLASVAGGVILLNLGFLLHVVSAWRSRDWGSLLFSSNGLAGIGLYWALAGVAVSIARGGSRSPFLCVVALLVPTVAILLREPLVRLIVGSRPLLESSWVRYLVRAFFELFESLIGYFTNSISFVRLGAFAVAHGALGQVVFIMADMSGGLGRWLIIIVGTAILIGFEGMVVGIQALRLEYYEFFDKFFQGTGRHFEPFQLPQEEDRAIRSSA